jgi:dTDP-4-amino-4,6-dideoxygalactose transaminase
MTERTNPTLAINGGKPVSAEPVLIHKPDLDEDDFAAVDRAMRSTFVSGDGPDCRAFEKMLADYLGARNVLYVNSATTALELAFRVKNFEQGSEVIVPDFTYTSTALGAIYNNLKIVLADVYPDNGSLNVSKIEKLITDRTVAIAPVDYAGIPADMDAINEIARRHNLYVVHDTAQSLGSVYRGRRTGMLADISTFSFHGTKNLTTGEGGAVVTDNDEVAARIRVLREKGTDKHSFLIDNRTRGFYEYIDTGNSYVQSNILGALGVSQMRKIDRMNARRTAIAHYYIERMSGIKGLDFLRITEGAETNWHIFGVLVPAEDRIWIMDALRAEGIMANIHYSPLHRNMYYRNLATDAEMSGSMEFFSRLLRLPLYSSLTDEEADKVTEAVIKVFNPGK